jgi:hypothetical protein
VIFKSEFETDFRKKIPELLALDDLVEKAKAAPVDARVVTEGTVLHRGIEFPLVSLTIGSRDPHAPTLAVFAGVHGLERIGADVALAWAGSVVSASHWDDAVVDRLKKTRLVLMPIVNPTGIYSFRRANANGVDLMRNSPVRASDPPFLLGGHDLSPKLPWFSKRVEGEAGMEAESRAVCDLVGRELSLSRFCISVDIHSGFGAIDRLWFPWAKSNEPPPYLAQIQALKELFDISHPNHVYKVEPQAKSYTTHGDLWDWTLEKHLRLLSDAPPPTQARTAEAIVAPGPFIPWTLELGSWLWVKKNPRQLFSSLGGFNPILPHRRKRILRRHLTLLDFFHRAVTNCDRWNQMDKSEMQRLQERAIDRWYKESA